MRRSASEVQRHYRNFISDLLGSLNKIYIVGLDAETNSQGDLIGFITLGPFQYKIQSERQDNEMSFKQFTKITIEGPGTRGKAVDSYELFYDPTWIDSKTGRKADKYDLFNVYTRKRVSDEILSQRGIERRVFRVDPKIVAKRIHKLILKLEQIALSDKAVSERAERKRLRREKMRVSSLENEFTEEELNIVWSVINYLYNDRPRPKHLLLTEWMSNYGHRYDPQVINNLFYRRYGDAFKALYAYNKSSKEALEVLKKRLEEIANSGHNTGN